MYTRSVLIKDTTKEEREDIIRMSLDCGGGCENCSSCWLGGGSPWDMYQDYIDGKIQSWRIGIILRGTGHLKRFQRISGKEVVSNEL